MFLKNLFRRKAQITEKRSLVILITARIVDLRQDERTRHNERLNEITTELQRVDSRLTGHDERQALTETRISGYQDELRSLWERLQLDRERLRAFLHALGEQEAEMRKRQIAALEKEMRDIRGRALNFADE